MTSLDYHGIEELLTDEERAARDRARRFVQEEVMPVVVPLPSRRQVSGRTHPADGRAGLLFAAPERTWLRRSERDGLPLVSRAFDQPGGRVRPNEIMPEDPNLMWRTGGQGGIGKSEKAFSNRAHVVVVENPCSG